MEFYSKPACQQTGKSGDFRYLLPTRRPTPACRQTGKSCGSRCDTLIKRHPEESISSPSGRYSQPTNESHKPAIKSNIRIYPIPSKGLLNIESSEVEGNVIVNLFDISGRVIYSDRIVLRKNSPSQLNVSNISNGLYFIQINKDGSYLNTSKILFE